MKNKAKNIMQTPEEYYGLEADATTGYMQSITCNPTKDFEFGDLIATRSNTFLSRAIRWFMKLQNPSEDTYSHIAVVINVWDERYIAEALGWGVRIHSLEDSGYYHKDCIILRHVAGFTVEQVKVMSKKCISLGGLRYQFENLPAWAIKLLFKINLFKPRSENAIYCSELGALAMNMAYPGTFKYPNITSPSDIYKSFLFESFKPKQ